MAASKYKGVRVLVAITCVTCLTLSHGREVDIHRTDVDSLTAYDKAKSAIGDCGGTFTSSSGTLTSPSYPFDYPNYADCYYSITVTQGYTIVLEFSLFVTEATFDTVEIFDGNSRYDTSLGEFSGSFINSQFTSSGRSLYIHFHSDGSNTASGFYATYRLGTQTSGYSLGDCGGTFTSDSGTLVSPSYPSHYSDSADCFYHISTSSGNTITIDISYVDTESCCDYVEVFDGTSRTATSLRRLSGSYSSIDPITSSGSDLYIHFHSDSSMSDRGFYATYTVNNFGSSNAGVIAGSVVGCIIFIIIIIAIIVACCYYSPKSSKTTSSTSNRAQIHPTNGQMPGVTDMSQNDPPMYTPHGGVVQTGHGLPMQAYSQPYYNQGYYYPNQAYPAPNTVQLQSDPAYPPMPGTVGN